MGAVAHADETGAHVHPDVDAEGRGQTSYPPTSPPNDGYIPPESDASASMAEPQDTVSMSGFTTCLLVFLIIFIAAAILASARPWYTLFFVFLAILPALPVARFILRNFRDNAVKRSFLLSQFLIGALPLVFLASQVEWVFSALIALVIFNSEMSAVEKAIDDVQGAVGSDDDKLNKILTSLSKIIPLWKFLLFFICMAFITAGTVEEVGKWIVARRYHKVEVEDAENRTRIGCRGILASACMSALGFAMTENVGYVVGIAQTTRNGFSFGLVGLALLRGVLAYPVHIGTQFYIGVSAAQRHVFSDKVSFGFALLVAVLFHGTFDAVAFVCMVLIGLEKIPGWVGGFVPVFDVVLIGFLLLLCRGRYKALLERERLVMQSSPV